MNWYKILKYAKSRTLYHGTSINNYNSIKDIGLIPDTGNFVSDSYAGEYEAAGVDFDPIPLTYAADKEDLSKAVTAMMYAVSKLLGKRGIHELSLEEIKKYGMIVVIKEGEDYYEQRPHEETGPYGDWQGETNNQYPAVEPGDYFSEYNQSISYILTGNKMANFLYKHGHWPPMWNNSSGEELRKQLLTLAIRYHIKKNPERKNEIIQTITQKVNNLDTQKIKEQLKLYQKLINEEYELV